MISIAYLFLVISLLSLHCFSLITPSRIYSKHHQPLCNSHLIVQCSSVNCVFLPGNEKRRQHNPYVNAISSSRQEAKMRMQKAVVSRT